MKCRFYTGLVWLQVLALWEFLGPAKYKLTIWGSSMKNPESSPSKRPRPSRKLNPMNQMFCPVDSPKAWTAPPGLSLPLPGILLICIEVCAYMDSVSLP